MSFAEMNFAEMCFAAMSLAEADSSFTFTGRHSQAAANPSGRLEGGSHDPCLSQIRIPRKIAKKIVKNGSHLCAPLRCLLRRDSVGTGTRQETQCRCD